MSPDEVGEQRSMAPDPELVDAIRRRLERDGQVIRQTKRETRPELIHRVATLATEVAAAPDALASWEWRRTRPLATPELDDPRDVLIGRLAVILGVADGGHHNASYDAVISAAKALKVRMCTDSSH